MTKVLTAKAVEIYEPGPKRRRIPDGGMRSLFLIIAPSGRKSWQMRFRTPTGRIGKLTLGRVYEGDETPGEPVIGEPLTLAGARQIATWVHRQRELGHDPVADNKVRKRRQRAEKKEHQAGAFAAFVRAFIDEHARLHARNWREQAKLLGLDYPLDGGEPAETKSGLVQRWADKPVQSIDGQLVWSVIDEAKRVGVPGLKIYNKGHSDARARGLYAALSGFFNWVRQQRLIHDNPCRSVQRPRPPVKRDHLLSHDELRWLWRATTTIDAPISSDAPKLFGPLLRLLLLTGQRRDEVAGMSREELRDGSWHLPGSRTKNRQAHVVPLSEMARTLVDGMPGDSGLVFTTNGGRTPVSGWSRMKHRLDGIMLERAREERGPKATIRPFRLHDLRRVVVTGMVELGVAPHVVELVVNHISGHKAGVAGNYNLSEMLPERRDALERWARFILLIVDQKLHAAHKAFLAAGDEENRKEADEAFKYAIAKGGDQWARYLKMIRGESNLFELKGRRRVEA